MAQPLEGFVQFSKSIYKMTKKQLKSLRKSAKKARKDKHKLPPEYAQEQLDEAFSLFEKYVDTTVSRELGEAETRVDLLVDGQLLLEQVTPRTLMMLRKQVKRLRKASQELAKLHGGDFDGLATRANRLEEALETALEQANHTPVEERQVSSEVLRFLRG